MTKVLVVDDSESFRFIISEMLKIRIPGVDIVEADDGSQGIEILEKYDYDFDVIVTDLQMPIMDGEEFAKNLRFVDKLVPVFLISGWTAGVKDVGLFTGIYDKSDVADLVTDIKKLRSHSNVFEADKGRRS